MLLYPRLAPPPPVIRLRPRWIPSAAAGITYTKTGLGVVGP